MPEEVVTLQTRFECVVWAIERITKARDRWVAANQDPPTHADDRDRLRNAYYRAEREFYMQWDNVKHVLSEQRRALESVVTIADEALQAWDRDEDIRAWQMLAALAGRLLNYRADTTAIHETLTAARGGERFYPGRHNAKAEAAHAPYTQRSMDQIENEIATYEKNVPHDQLPPRYDALVSFRNQKQAKAEAAHAREREGVCGSCGGRTINGSCGRGC